MEKGSDERPEPEVSDDLKQALEALRREIRARFPGRGGEPAPAAIDWDAIYAMLRRSIGTFGMSERSGEVDEFGMDEVVLGRARSAFDFLYDQYWRVSLAGVENLPPCGPCLLVANHSGLLPYDGLMLAHGIERSHPNHERPRFLAADWLITLPFVQSYLARLGGVRACRENAERLLESKRFVITFPEGVKGPPRSSGSATGSRDWAAAASCASRSRAAPRWCRWASWAPRRHIRFCSSGPRRRARWACRSCP
jgi:hypothetical protein